MVCEEAEAQHTSISPCKVEKKNPYRLPLLCIFLSILLGASLETALSPFRSESGENPGAISALQDCFEHTAGDMFREAATDGDFTNMLYQQVHRCKCCLHEQHYTLKPEAVDDMQRCVL